MKGFDKKYKSFPDFILEITKQIWEGKDVNSIADFYTNDIRLIFLNRLNYQPNNHVLHDHSVCRALANPRNIYRDDDQCYVILYYLCSSTLLRSCDDV